MLCLGTEANGTGMRMSLEYELCVAQITFPFCRFLDKYTKHNVTFWVSVLEIEPLAGQIKN